MDTDASHLNGNAMKRSLHPSIAQDTIISAMLSDWENIETAKAMGVVSASFNVATRPIYDAITTVWADNGPVDLVTVGKELKEIGDLYVVGGPDRLEKLANHYPEFLDFAEAVSVVIGSYRKNKSRLLLEELSPAVYDKQFERARELLDEIEGIANDGKRKYFNRISIEALLERPPKEYLIDRLIGQREIVAIFGPPKSGKSFVVLDMVFAMITGKQFAREFNTPRPLTIAYCTNEGRSGLPDRMMSLISLYRAMTDDLERLHYYEDVPQLFSDELPGYVDNFINDIKKTGDMPNVVVIDTLRNATIGSQENQSDDAAIVHRNSIKLIDALDCTVMWVHHTSRANGGMRGSIGYEGHADLMLKVDPGMGNKMDRIRTFEYYAGKDTAPFQSQGFTLQPLQPGDTATVSWQGEVERESIEPRLNAQEKILSFLNLHRGEKFSPGQIAIEVGLKELTVKSRGKELEQKYGVIRELIDPNLSVYAPENGYLYYV